MTDEARRFCGSCGAALPPTAAFCTDCGTPTGIHPNAPVAPVLVPQTTAPAEYWSAGAPGGPAGGRGPRRRVVVVAVVAVLALIGVGTVAVFLLRDGGGDGRLPDGGKLAAAVTSEPELQWEWNAPGPPGSVVKIGDTTVVGLGEGGEVIALDGQGEELWSNDDEFFGYASAYPGDDGLVIVNGYEGTGVWALSVEDGDEVWEAEGDYVAAMTGDGIFVNAYDEDESAGELALLEPETGEERWTTGDVDTSAVTEDAVYVVVDGDLRRLEPDSGDQVWSVDLDLGSDDYPSLAATDELIAVSGSEVTGYSSDDGERLWSEGPDDTESSLYIGAFGSDSVFVNETYYDSELEESTETVRVFDLEGEVGELDNDKDEPFYATSFRSGGKDYLLNNGDGTLYDDTLERVGSYEGVLTVVDRGLYGLDDDELAYYELGEQAAVWEVDVSSGDSRLVAAADDAVYVVVNDEVTAYR